MTTAITPTTTDTASSSERTGLRTLTAFVAGLALAGALAVGINLAGDSGTTSAPTTPAAATAAQHPSTDGGCVIVHGRC